METEQKHKEITSQTPLPSKKTGKFRLGFALTVEGLNILKKDKQTLLFPIFSLFASILLLIFFFTAYWFFGGSFDEMTTANIPYGFGFAGYSTFFLLYIALAFITVFFQSGLIAVVDARMNGKNMTYKEGLNTAVSHIERIFLWSFIFVTADIVFVAISEETNQVLQVTAYFLSIAWGVATFFIVPSLILEDGGIFNAIRNSTRTFKKIWSEIIIISFSIGLFLLCVVFCGILLVALLMVLCKTLLAIAIVAPLMFFFAVLFVIFLVGIGVLFSGISSVLQVVLYKHAKGDVDFGILASESVSDTI